MTELGKYLSSGEHCVLCLDPGDHTGWFVAHIHADGSRDYNGGTAGRDHLEVAQLFKDFNPDVVVMESFHLYPGMAKSLSWNSFYPCEVIGVIRYICMLEGRKCVEQSPSIKKYSGGLNQLWKSVHSKFKFTEHVKDAFLHWRYFARQNGINE